MFPETFEFHVASHVNNGVDWLLQALAPTFDSISSGILTILLGIENFLHIIPWWIYIVVIALLAWKATQRLSTTITLPISILFIGIFGLWDLAIGTLAVVIAAVFISLLIGIPLGILMAETKGVEPVMRPILDAMQTMPSFVYLIPAMMFFGLGKVPAVLATLIYSLPPVIRLTNLGLRQVPKPAQEAAIAYGATKWQLLKEVRVPLAMPTIMAGVNQTTMMALSMVVVASMIGARGLGQEVLLSINRIDVGRGFEAGISIVIMAITIDRITQGFAKKWDPIKR
ncbi:MAG: proline/glycine betaine ABC transporter permease [Aminobacterium sp.]|uniref:ABC transporter permease n=1 Tax=unclassified Aminobacterium TaxID=2685012 RepID=UPI001BD0DDF0|nr:MULTISPECIES: proline/glycine betaine ABC transporter permease [unclassified Aminobacterium]MEA4877627.1 proline/glycine betaine ABC transporter permease [Aminobacterium sp.]WMI72661.1 proline/glycine betaine ABC transporter permease [Aminobacterium sp. MB27-C1]